MGSPRLGTAGAVAAVLAVLPVLALTAAPSADAATPTTARGRPGGTTAPPPDAALGTWAGPVGTGARARALAAPAELPETGMIDTKPYVIGGACFLLVGAGLLVGATRFSRRPLTPEPAEAGSADGPPAPPASPPPPGQPGQRAEPAPPAAESMATAAAGSRNAPPPAAGASLQPERKPRSKPGADADSQAAADARAQCHAPATTGTGAESGTVTQPGTVTEARTVTGAIAGAVADGSPRGKAPVAPAAEPRPDGPADTAAKSDAARQAAAGPADPSPGAAASRASGPGAPVSDASADTDSERPSGRRDHQDDGQDGPRSDNAAPVQED